MIFAGGIILIVFMGLNIMILISRAQKHGCKIRGMGKVGDIGYGKRRDKLGQSMRWCSLLIGHLGSDGLMSPILEMLLPYALHEIPLDEKDVIY